MRNFTGFKYQKSVLRTVEEPRVKKGFNWDRLLFICLLLGIATYFVVKTYTRVAFVSVHGQVLMEKLNVHFTEDIRIRGMRVEEGQPVETGDTLFTYRYEDRQHVNPLDNLKMKARYGNTDQDHWFLKEKMNAKRMIEVKKGEREGAERLIRIKERELAEQKKQILLGVDVAHKLPPLITKIADLQADKKIIDREISAYRKHLSELRRQEKLYQQEQAKLLSEQLAVASGAGSIGMETQFYVSPIDGLIGRIFNDPNEVCYESENVMTIHKMEKLKIRAYFDPESNQELGIGDEVTINFPDGTVGRGYIHNFYVSTYPLPPEFQSRHEPIKRSIVADVLPVNEEEARHWTAYYKMAVEVVKRKL